MYKNWKNTKNRRKTATNVIMHLESFNAWFVLSFKCVAAIIRFTIGAKEDEKVSNANCRGVVKLNRKAFLANEIGPGSLLLTTLAGSCCLTWNLLFLCLYQQNRRSLVNCFPNIPLDQSKAVNYRTFFRIAWQFPRNIVMEEQFWTKLYPHKK